MPSSYLLTIASSFFLPNLKEDSLVMGLWTWSLKKKEISVGEDGEEGKKKEKEVIGRLKVGVSCHFSSGGGDLIRIGVYSELLVYYTMGNLVTSNFFFLKLLLMCVPHGSRVEHVIHFSVSFNDNLDVGGNGRAIETN